MDLDRRPEGLPAALDDAALEAQRPAVRGLLVERLSGLWDTAAEELDGGKDRVRWAELQLRVVDRLMKLYRMDQPAPADPEDDDTAGIEQERLRLAVIRDLDDLADRQGQGARPVLQAFSSM